MGNIKWDACMVEDCDKPRPYRHGYCELHYNRWVKNGDPLVVQTTGRKKYNGPCIVDECSNGGKFTRRMCGTHYTRALRTGETNLVERKPRDTWRTTNDQGYVILTLPDGRRVREHRWIMEIALGRLLLEQETVHHINGQRNDNRLENLELWSSSQPPGQRIEDKLAWAKEIIELYGN